MNPNHFTVEEVCQRVRGQLDHALAHRMESVAIDTADAGVLLAVSENYPGVRVEFVVYRD